MKCRDVLKAGLVGGGRWSDVRKELPAKIQNGKMQQGWGKGEVSEVHRVQNLRRNLHNQCSFKP